MSTKLILQKNPFSNDKIVQYTDDKTIAEIIKEIDVSRAVNTGWRILLNDRIISDYSVKTHDGDTVYIKIVPESDWDNQDIGTAEKIGGGVLIAAGILVGVLSYGTLGWLGSGLIGAGVSMFFNGVVTYNTDIPNAKEREKPEQSPSIRGSRNQSRPLGYIPILLGKRRIYPDLITTPYTMIENGEQYFYQLFCCGQKNQTIDTSTLKIDETLLTEFSSSHNMSTILAGNDSLINLQIAYGASTPPLITKCVHEDMLNATLKHELEDGSDGCIIRTTPDNTTEINVDIFFYSGIGEYDDDGDLTDRSVTVKAWYKKAQQDDTHYVALGHFASNDVITDHELKTKRFSINKSGLTADSYTVKIERVTADADDSKIIDVCYVGSIRSIKNESPVSSSMCQKLTLVGLKVKASEKLNNYIEQLNFVTQASLPSYSGSGSGASKWSYSPSCNPAAAAMYAMQCEIAQQKLANSEIDWIAFERLYTWCSQNDYECNEYITDSMAISELLSSIGSTCRAEIFRQNGKITVIQDIARNGFVQVFTPRNSWGYEETITKAEIPDALAIGFVDKTTGYAENELKIYNTPSGNPSGVPDTVQDLNLWGVTSSEQARKIGMYKHAVSRSRPIIHKFSADFEYMLCSKGDWIKYAGDIALAGISQGRIKEVITQSSQVIGVSCDEKLELEYGESYAIRIRKSDGTAILKNIDNYDVTTNTAYFETPETTGTIHEGDLFTFGTVGNDSIDLIITDIQCGENLSADIIAVEYAPQIFNVDSPDFVLPTFENKITPVKGVVDSGNLVNWNNYTTYNDSYDKPQAPVGDGTQNGWHYNLTDDSKWQSIKTARTITEGVWSAPIQTTKRVETALEKGAYPELVPEKYLGPLSSGNPDKYPGNYFLATATWSINPTSLYLLDVGEGYVLGAGDYVLGVTECFRRGMIYVSDGVAWEEITDRENYRYIFALSDMIAAGIEIPYGLTEMVGSVISDKVPDMLPAAVNEYTPKYYGYCTSFPVTAHKDDSLVYTDGNVWQYDGTHWLVKSPTDPANYGLYMTALSDIINHFPDNPNCFSYIFTNLLMAQDAVIQNLQVKIFELLSGGAIKGNFNGIINSSGLITSNGTTGFAIDNSGKAVYNDLTMRGVIHSNGLSRTLHTISWDGNTSTFTRFVAEINEFLNYLASITTNTREIFSGEIRLNIRGDDGSTFHYHGSLIDFTRVGGVAAINKNGFLYFYDNTTKERYFVFDSAITIIPYDPYFNIDANYIIKEKEGVFSAPTGHISLSKTPCEVDISIYV